jgi:hypothetical protein
LGGGGAERGRERERGGRIGGGEEEEEEEEEVRRLALESARSQVLVSCRLRVFVRGGVGGRGEVACGCVSRGL